MKYLTGILAFGVECERNSVGKWNITKSEFMDDKLFVLKESEDSPFKDWGIEKNKLVPYREFCVYNVADHPRAYCDLLYEHNFEFLKDAFYEYINDPKCRSDIFMIVYGKLRHLAGFHEINEFMMQEFGNAWISYVDGVESMAEHLSKHSEEMKELDRLQNGYVNKKPMDVVNAMHDNNQT